jgi:hypothetical protein
VANDDEPEHDDEGSNTSGDVRSNKRSVSPGDDGDPRSKKKRRESQAYTLADTIRRIKDQPLLATGNGRPSRVDIGAIAEELITKLKAKVPEVEFHETDLSILGSILFVDIFGTVGRGNLSHLIEEYRAKKRLIYQATYKKAAALDQLNQAGQPKLTSLLEDWTEVISLEDTTRSPIGRLFVMTRKVSIVRQWDHLLEL